ncbi:MAG TPA: cache domain-containing protein, partial [Magnetospirillum sp.]|nr:cache domain-containing protein [Magnetospirillum sp.]
MLRRILPLGVAQKITIFVIAALTLVAAINSTALTLYVSQSLERMTHERLQENLSVLFAVLNPRQESFSLRDGQLFLGERPLDGDNDVLDAVVGAVGGVATIFKGDERVATTITKDGQRAVGTRLAAGAIHDTIFKEGYRYTGPADVLGQSYMTVYEPIYDDATSKVIGILFVGMKASEFQSLTHTVASIALMIGGTAAAVLSGLTFVGLRRMLRPFGPLTRLMDEATHGNYPDNVPHTQRGDEFGALARAIGAFGDAMRDAERQRAEQEAHEREVILGRKREMLALADNMDVGIRGAIQAIARQAAGLNATAQTLLESAESTSQRAVAVADASHTATGNVQTVAVATGQLSDSSEEIGRQAE